MPDVDQSYLMQQQELLKEIRDELRFSRQSASAAATGSGGGGSASSAHPGQTFTQFQSATDKTLLGDWNSLGWSNAYKSLYTSSYTGDLAGASGFSRAPETMTQMEFQALSRQSLGFRTATALGSMIAPEYTQFSNELTGSIYRNSQRFIRAGSAQAGAFGAGLSFSAAGGLASAVGGLALNDSRLSSRDYGNIVDVGMRTNQYNDVSSSDDFVKRTKELAEATASLTRTLHMSVGEISQAMGNMRTMGVGGVAKQQALLSHLNGMSGVAGMPADEMLRFTGNFAEGMMGSGVNAAAAMQLSATNAATVRNAAAMGYVSANAIAQGGGALQVAATMSRAQLGFAASMPGYLALRGGNGSNTFQSMVDGLGGYQSADSMFGMGLDRAEALDGMSGASAAKLFRNNMTSGLKMLGMDPNSRAGQGVMFQRLQSQFGMDAGAARAWIASNSGDGLQAADATEMAGFRHEDAARVRDQQDLYFSRNSFTGRMAAGNRWVAGIGRGVVDSVTSSLNWLGSSNVDAQERRIQAYGTQMGTTGMSLSARANLISSGRAGRSESMELSSNDGAWASGALGLVASTGFGAAGVAGLAGAFGQGLGAMGWAGAAGATTVGTFALPLLAGAAVLGAGYLAVNAMTGEKHTVEDARTISAIKRMTRANRSANGERGLGLLKEKGLAGSAWDQLRAMGGDASDAEDTVRMAQLAQQVSEQNDGVSIQSVMDMRAAVAGTTTTADVFMVGKNKFTASSDSKDAIKKLLGDDLTPRWWGGYAQVTGTNLAAQSGLMQKYIKSVQRGNGRAGDVETAELRKMMGHPDTFDQFARNVSKMHGNDPSSLDRAAAGFQDSQSAVENAMLTADEDAARRFMESQISDPDKRVSAADRSLFEKSMDKLESGQLFDTLGSGRMRELADSGIFGEATKTAVGVASDTDLARMSVEDVNKRYNLHISKDDWTKAVTEQGGDGSLRAAVQSSIFGSSSAKKEQAESETEAKLLSRTAQVLTALETKLNAGAAGNAGTE